MDCKIALPAILVIIAFAVSSVTGRELEPTHGCNKACPAYAPASGPAPKVGMVSGAAHHAEQALHHAGANNPDAWDSKHDFCTAGSLAPADLDAEENHILHHLKHGSITSIFRHKLKDEKLKLGPNETKAYVNKTAKFHIHNLETNSYDVPGNKLKDASDKIKNSCCSDKNSTVCLGGWFTIGTDSVFIRIAPPPEIFI